MILRTAITAVIGVALGILQSTVLARLAPGQIVPDLALIVLVAASWQYGALTGEIVGFVIGLALDSMSLAPPGFHALSYTLVGYLFGKLKGNISAGPFLAPLVATLGALAIKYGMAALITIVFGLETSPTRFFTLRALWEGGFDLVLAPLLFWVVARVVMLTDRRRGGFH